MSRYRSGFFSVTRLCGPTMICWEKCRTYHFRRMVWCLIDRMHISDNILFIFKFVECIVFSWPMSACIECNVKGFWYFIFWCHVSDIDTNMLMKVSDCFSIFPAHPWSWLFLRLSCFNNFSQLTCFHGYRKCKCILKIFIAHYA